ncbi:MAG: hypothetical protein CMH56_04360 [Myxococcales bacterium]|nr:hypothetical protein [Myxococcales bacterium]|tara:strand:- start:828 stop:2417 length:1590 start_codon:yes stop_codon:yes gene_type:complete
MEPIKFGRYILLERLAIGGMAEVFLAFDKKGKPGHELVALKRILPVIAEEHNFIAMFIDEGRLLGQLQHKNILKIFDMGNKGSIYFQSLEFVFGVSLRNLWEITWHTQKFPLDLATLIMQRIATALDVAHKKRDQAGKSLKIIHRDVSPQNILVSFDGDLKIIDFGIAKAEDRIASTRQGVIKGKVTYMAPEQAKGQPFDHRIDIYALGLIFYELVTGKRAFKADNDFDLLQKVREGNLNEREKELQEFPSGLSEIILKATNPDPDRRYKWASELSADLSRLMTTSNWLPDKDDLANLTRKIFRTHYRAQKKRLKEYIELGQTGFTPEQTNTTAQALVPAQDQFTEISLDPEPSDSQTELVPIGDGLNTHTDPFSPAPLDLTQPEAQFGQPGQSSALPDPSMAWPIKKPAVATAPQSQHPTTISPPQRSHLPRWFFLLLLVLGLGFYVGTLFNLKPPQMAVTSSPKGAAVFCENKPVCAKTPCVFQANCPSQKYIIQKKGYHFEVIHPDLEEEVSLYHLDLRPQLNIKP